VHINDVLNGRGVNIAHHPGNERFRKLITMYLDKTYCTSYSASEKRAVAVDIISHIKSLNPPGRFLKRDGKGQVSRGLGGPWQLLSEREAIKKTTQALRDCNRPDRIGYAQGVTAPTDVKNAEHTKGELTVKERFKAAAAKVASENSKLEHNTVNLKRGRQETYSAHSATSAHVDTQGMARSHCAVAPNHHLPLPLQYPAPIKNPPIIMSAVSGIPTFPHAPMQQNSHPHGHCTNPYLPQMTAVPPTQHQPPSYLPYAIATPALPPSILQHDVPPNLASLFTAANNVGMSNHLGHNTPPSSSNMLLGSTSHAYENYHPNKKQLIADEPEPSVVSNSPSTTTPLDHSKITCSQRSSPHGPSLSSIGRREESVENKSRNHTAFDGGAIFPNNNGHVGNLSRSKNGWERVGIPNGGNVEGEDADQDHLPPSLHKY